MIYFKILYPTVEEITFVITYLVNIVRAILALGPYPQYT